MKLTASEVHFIKRNIDARIEWVKDNPADASEEEGEVDCLKSVLNKLNKFGIVLKAEVGERL